MSTNVLNRIAEKIGMEDDMYEYMEIYEDIIENLKGMLPKWL